MLKNKNTFGLVDLLVAISVAALAVLVPFLISGRPHNGKCVGSTYMVCEDGFLVDVSEC